MGRMMGSPSMAADIECWELDQARELLAQAEEHVALQESRIEELRAEGHDTTSAEAFLKVLEDTREVMRKHLEVIQGDLGGKGE